MIHYLTQIIGDKSDGEWQFRPVAASVRGAVIYHQQSIASLSHRLRSQDGLTLTDIIQGLSERMSKVKCL